MQKLFVSCMRKRRRGWIDLFAAVVYWLLCVLGFEKTPYSQWDASAWRPVVSFDSVWPGDEDGIYGRMETGGCRDTGAALMIRDLAKLCGYLIRIGILLMCPVSAVSVSHDRCGRYQDGSGSVWCCGGAAGRADPFLCGLMAAAGAWSACFTWFGVGLPGSGLHILCFICTGLRLGEASSRTIWKRGMEKRHLFVWHRACFWE